MTTTLRKSGKCIAIKITPEIRQHVETFKRRLIQMAEHEDETSDFDVATIDIILNKLDDYDRNFICAFYSIADGSPTKLGKIFGTGQSTITQRIKRLHKLIQELNDTPRTTYNYPREYNDN